MQPLDLDHVRTRSRAPWVRYALAAAALGFAADQAAHYRSTAARISFVEARLAERPRAAATPTARKLSAEELAVARDTVGRLGMPWEVLFRALENAHTDHVTLSSIEPDAQARTVLISGEAKDYLAALSYVAALAEQPALRRVHLARHEVQKNGSARPLAFAVSAAWRDSP